MFVKSANPSALRMIYLEKNNPPVIFQAVAVRLGKHLYLDIVPDAPRPFADNAFVATHFTVWHTFARVEIEKSQLRLWFADPQWLFNHLDRSPATIAHFRDRQRVILTASTPALQDFVVQNEALFSGNPATLNKEQGSAQK